MNEPEHDKTYKMACAPSEDSISLGICTQWVAKDQSFVYADSEDWSDWVDARADLSLRCAHMSFCRFCHALAQMRNAVWNR